MIPTQTTDLGAAQIISVEGIVTGRYLDSVGVDTDGIGHTAAAGGHDPAKRPYGVEIPMDEILETFRQDLRTYEKRVTRALKISTTPAQYDGMTSFDLNTGGIDRATLTKSHNAGDFFSAANQFMNWVKPPEITGRRKKEQLLYRDGVYSTNGVVGVYPADGRGRPLYSKGYTLNIMPTLAHLRLANGADDVADSAKKKVAPTAGVGAGSGGATTIPDPIPGMDSGSARLFFIGLVIVAVAGVIYFVTQTNKNRKKAKEYTETATIQFRMSSQKPVKETSDGDRTHTEGRHISSTQRDSGEG